MFLSSNFRQEWKKVFFQNNKYFKIINRDFWNIQNLRRKIIPYNPKLKERARELRKNMTQTEIMLWQELKGKQMCGFDFDRQRPIDNFILDFYCKDLLLAIEIDGESHIGNEEKDKKRQNKIESHGVSFLRFEDFEVRYKMDKVLETITNWINQNNS